MVYTSLSCGWMYPCANRPIHRHHPAYSFSVDNQTLTDTVKSQQARLHDIYSTVAGEKDMMVCGDLWILTQRHTACHPTECTENGRCHTTYSTINFFCNTDAELFVENPLHLRGDPENKAQGKSIEKKCICIALNHSDSFKGLNRPFINDTPLAP